MTHLFIPYLLALLAKEKGFDEPCMGVFAESKRLYIIGEAKLKMTPLLKAPIYQQIVDWFREEHYLDLLVLPEDTKYTAIVRSRTLHESVFIKEKLQYKVAKDLVIEEALKLIKI